MTGQYQLTVNEISLRLRSLSICNILNDLFKQLQEILSFSTYMYISFVQACGHVAKHAYQVMLTIRGCLITPFILGSMSVGLNILMRHLFTDLWD